jgi:hypothetical protein
MVGLGSACTAILGTFDDKGDGGVAGNGGASATTATITTTSSSESTSSGTCANPAAACHDNLQDCSETDVDCGGGVCAPCPDGDCCNQGTDCSSGYCFPGIGVCYPGSCNDHLKDGSETDVDCGGGCPNCPAGKHCLVDNDCIGTCVNMVCT